MQRQVAVVVGAGGMGLAIARRVGSGRTVLLADVHPAALDRAADLLRDEGQQVETQPVDVADAASVAALAAAAEGLGPVTHVVHTAGLSPVQAPAEAVLRVDLLGVAHALDAFGRVIAPGGAGVVIASMAGHLAPLPSEQEPALAATPPGELLALPFVAEVTDPGWAYVLAKRATVLRVQAAATAWGARGGRVNSISPGVISTSMGREELAGSSGAAMQGMIDASPAGRTGTADEIADAAAFLLGPGAAFVTGTDLLVDGGAVAAVRSMLAAG